eukprot:CAMPEP_0202084208 /NCGR_PEP_ID=MMETSP0964-20121228/26888_1 /ASSEMBLY_ACC=CAM_ASM_000500 /TAXON_ID=4773 /ORGANISM="Schizochytrium aggregatum, Strain ATCC28209" /LENGTH=147 /DNA_ID=CAMNT_0048651969 /DNA_START=72 /DNA_END=512 /DNA_ORIENTATION=-
MQNILVACVPRGSRHHERDCAQIKLQLSQVSQEFEAHRERIFEKFVEMIDAVLSSCCGPMMASVDWDARAPQDIKPEDYMMQLTKGVKDLHKSLSKYLPADHLQHVFSKIFALFNRRVPELYASVQPQTGVGVSQIRVDLRNLAHCL